MTPNQKEALQKLIEQGHQAREVQSAAGDMFEQREEQIVKDAIAAFRTNKLDGNTALRYLAALSEVRALREELLYRERKGNEATEKLMSSSTEGKKPSAERS